MLTQLTDWLRRSRAVRTIEIDEGWSDDRDVSVLVGRWAWLDVRALVEEHGGGKALLRVSTHLRPTSFGIVSAIVLRRRRCSSPPSPASRCAGRRPARLPRRCRWSIAGFVVVAHGADDRDRAARRRRGHRARSTWCAMPSGAAASPLIAPSMLRTLRPAERRDLRRHDRRRSAPARSCCAKRRRVRQVIGAREGYAGDNGPAISGVRSTRRAASPSRRTATSTSPIRTTTSSRRIDARNNITTVAGNTHSARASRATTVRRPGAARHAGRRRDRSRRRSDRRRLAQRSHPPRRRADARHHDDRRLRRNRLRRRRQAGHRSGAEHTRAASPRRRTATSTSPTR